MIRRNDDLTEFVRFLLERGIDIILLNPDTLVKMILAMAGKE
jgi:hypothetical protein